MRTWAVFLVLGLLLSGCGTAAASGAFDYLYPDSPKAAKTPVSVPLGGKGP
ncbi:MAG: hypothetical protein HOY71_08420, partial [Nonomuraea sp.]|nr:hypothetical protein [Nonomuraea sp.]